MAADIVLSCHTKKFKKEGQGHIFWYPKETANLKMIHDEINALTNNELLLEIS